MELVSSQFSINSSFFGSISPNLRCSPSKKNIFSTIFFLNVDMCFAHAFPMELKFTICDA